ncbi:MAG: hypothetical protein Q9214_000184, partial [Letrouitia sp. 1 TL-2023]
MAAEDPNNGRTHAAYGLMAKIMRPPHGEKIVSPASLTGFLNLWLRMYLNGTIDALDQATKAGSFPDGHPLLNRFIGIPPIDNAIATLVGFFDGMTNGSDLGARLLFIDVVSTLQAAILWLMIETLSKERRKSISLWVPALWALLWNGFGAAFILPIYCCLQLRSAATKTTSGVPSHHAKALLPAVTLASIMPAIVMFLSPALTSTPKQHQTLIALYQATPVFTIALQLAISSLWSYSTETSKPTSGSKTHVKVALAAAALFSCATHLYAVSASVFAGDPMARFARVYVPNPASVQRGADDTVAKGAMLFMQYDNLIIMTTCTTWIYLLLQPYLYFEGGVRKFAALAGLALGTVILGPGAVVSIGLWWREDSLDENEWRLQKGKAGETLRRRSMVEKLQGSGCPRGCTVADPQLDPHNNRWTNFTRQTLHIAVRDHKVCLTYPRFIMPFIRDTSSRSSSSSDGQRRSLSGPNQIVDDDEYPAVSFPGYAEKPLSEQLEPVAIVGMGCRLPGDVDSPEGFWDLMMNRRSGMTPKVPKSRFNIDAHFHANNDRPGSFNVMGGYFLNSDLQEFDPALFGISPVEAMWMDPQQRKLLEVVYEAFESGGATLQSVAGSNTACFAGSFTADFQQMSFKEPDFRHSYAATGVDPGIISNRVNHVFNLKGPSITVNTACSSSVYAIHNACNALRNDECTAAVVAGTNLILTVDQHMNTAKLGVLSPDSTCHTFQETANGYGRAEGVGAVYLKRLSDAVRDGDPIRGVVRSSAVNSNGKAPAVGITHPNKQGQVDVIRHAYHRGGDLDPRLTGYFECHGTGTAIGDPLEVHAVAKAMNGPRKAGEEPLLIGAVKTNIGHSEAASGLSAIIKACLTVEKGIIPPTRIVDKLSNKVEWDNWKVRVVQEPQPFPAHLPVRRVSVNSFGYGGTNAHIIIENVESFVPGYQHAQRKSKSRRAHDQNRPYLLPFSAHDKPTLKRNIEAHSKVAGNYNLLDLSYTLATRRSNLQSKGFVVATDATLKNAFANNGESFAFAEKKKKPTIGFAFTGQGAQWARMGSHLMEYYPSFLRSIRKLDQALEDLPDAPEWTLEDTLLESAEKSRVNEAEFSQPLCTAIQVALVELLSTWGVQPLVTVGHSSGEIAASFAAGLISATEAIIVAYYRGKVVRDVNTNGAMMAVGLGAEAVEPYLADVDGKVVIACHNSPMSVTLSGDADALDTVKAKLDAQKVFARPVKTGGKAYHSSHMQAVADQYKTYIRNAKKHSPFDPPTPTKVVMVSSVTDSALDPSHKVDENYWCQNLTSPVLFNQAIQRIATDDQFSKVDLLIEIGPHSALSGPIRQICVEHGFEKLGYIPSLVRNADSAQQLLKVAGELFLRNYPLNMERVTVTEEALPSGKINLAKGKMLVDLPGYQWNYAKNLWAEPRGSAEHRTPRRGRHDILGSRMPGGSKVEPIWRNALRIRDLPWLNSHSLGGEAVFPAAGYFSMAMEAVTQINEDSAHPEEIYGYVLRDVSIKAALVTPDTDDGIEVLFSMRPSVFSETEAQVTWWDFNVSSITEDGLVKDHMTGTISINTRPRGEKPKKIPNFPQRASGKSWNQGLRDVGFDYGPGFQDMTDIRSDGKNFMAASDTIVKQACGDMIGESRHVLHPGTVDSCLQLIIVSIYAGRLNDMACGAVPIQVDEVAIWPPTPEQLKNPAAKAFSWTDHRGIRSFQSGSQLTAFDGELLMDITDMRTTAYEAALPPKADDAAETQPFMEMVWKCDIDSLASTSQLQQVDINRIVELAAHKNPSIKVLEIGSNNAAAILSKSSLLRYTATEVSEEGVNAAEEVIKGYKNAKAQLFDFTGDNEEQ